MFCKFCGKKIEDNSRFCNYCGKSLEENSSDKVADSNNNQSKKSGCGSFLIFLLVLGLVVGIIFAVVKISMNQDSNGSLVDKIIERDIVETDYSVNTSQDLTSISITITPNKKLNSCNVEITIYNSKGNLIYSDTITKNDLMENSSYTYTFDFGFTNSLTASKFSYKITGKCFG